MDNRFLETLSKLDTDTPSFISDVKDIMKEMVGETEEYQSIKSDMDFYTGVNEAKKSKEASEVLQGMDNDMSYEDALKSVLSKYPKCNKVKLEKELDTYI